MPPDPFQGLTTAELEDLLVELGGHAAYRARNFWWRSGNWGDLAGGMQVKDVVQEALTRVLEERRHFDGARGGLLPYLKAVIDSIIANLAASLDNRSQKRIPEYGASEQESIERLRSQARAIDPLAWFGRSENPSAESAMGEEELSAPRVLALASAIGGDKELEVLFKAIQKVGGKPALIADHASVPIEKVYEGIRRLRKIALSIAERGTKEPDS